MSGPKKSELQIMQEKAAKLARERELALERERKRLREENARARKKLDTTVSSINALLHEIELLKAKAISHGVSVLLMSEVIEKISEIKTTMLFETPSDTQGILSCDQRITPLIAEMKQMSSQISMLIVEKEKSNQVNDILLDSVSKHKVATFDFSINSKRNIVATVEQASTSKLDEIRDQFLTISSKYSELPSEYNISQQQKAFMQIYENSALSIDNRLAQLQMRINLLVADEYKYDKALEKNLRNSEKYSSLLIEYQSLCSILHVNKREFSKMQLNELEAEVVALAEQYKDRQESEYIRKNVNEVMSMFGFDILHETVLEKKKGRLTQEIYEFEGDAVNVYIGENGEILFEVSALSDKPKALSSTEKTRLKEKMQQFCGKYDQISTELRNRGITMSNESKMPADEAFAKCVTVPATVLRPAERASRKKKQQALYLQ